MQITDENQSEQCRRARLSRDARFDGSFFIAVKSTGIFCRPVCPARSPAEKNVLYYSQAVTAMQAGYRPCLRCRPDSAPFSAAWCGTDTSLFRAQRLLSELPPQPVSRIAERMGITPRYLHKLFTARLGASPKVFQQSQQLLFAKQLLQQSSLPVTDIALAAGFDSARQLQRQMQRYWSLTPSAVRGRSSTGNSAQAISIKLTLNYRPPYNWPAVRDFLKKRLVACIEDVTEHSYVRHFRYEQCEGKLKATHKPQHNGFEVVITLSHVEFLHTVVSNLTRVLDLNADPAQIELALIQAGMPQAELTSGLRLPGAWSPFEAAVRAILGQQVSVVAAIRLLNKFCDYFYAHTGIQSFPLPEDVMNDDLT